MRSVLHAKSQSPVREVNMLTIFLLHITRELAVGNPSAIVGQTANILGTFRLDYEYETEYEYEFRISNQ